MSERWSECENARYASLETYRKDGTAVRTPVWIAPDTESHDRRLIVWTVADSWKVHRIKGNPQVRMAPCTARGGITGSWTPARAVLLTPGQSKIAVRALYRKYGLLARLTVLGSRIRRKAAGTVCIAIMPAQ